MLEFVWNNPAYEESKNKIHFAGFGQEYVNGLESGGSGRVKRQKIANEERIYVRSWGAKLDGVGDVKPVEAWTGITNNQKKIQSADASPFQNGDLTVADKDGMTYTSVKALKDEYGPDGLATTGEKFALVKPAPVEYGIRNADTYPTMNIDGSFRGASCTLKKIEFLFSKEYHGIHKVVLDFSDIVGADGAITIADSSDESSSKNSNKITCLFDGTSKKETIYYDCGIGTFSDTRFKLGVSKVEYQPRLGCPSYGFSPGCDVVADYGQVADGADPTVAASMRNRFGYHVPDLMGGAYGGQDHVQTKNLNPDEPPYSGQPMGMTFNPLLQGQPHGYLLHAVVNMEVGM
jgi:hypothetical protein